MYKRKIRENKKDIVLIVVMPMVRIVSQQRASGRYHFRIGYHCLFDFSMSKDTIFL